MAAEDRRDSRRGGDRIVFDGPKRPSEAAGRSLNDRIRDNQEERRQRDGDMRRRDDSPDRRSRRPERRLEDNYRSALADGDDKAHHSSSETPLIAFYNP